MNKLALKHRKIENFCGCVPYHHQLCTWCVGYANTNTFSVIKNVSFCKRFPEYETFKTVSKFNTFSVFEWLCNLDILLHFLFLLSPNHQPFQSSLIFTMSFYFLLPFLFKVIWFFLLVTFFSSSAFFYMSNIFWLKIVLSFEIFYQNDDYEDEEKPFQVQSGFAKMTQRFF